jgi:hypothetical protein
VPRDVADPVPLKNTPEDGIVVHKVGTR